MIQITATEVRDLAAQEDDALASVYFPTRRSEGETHQGPIHLKNSLKEIQRALDSRNEKRLAERLAEARRLTDDTPFFEAQRDGLALFLSAAALRVYALPVPCERLVILGRRFHIIPLLPAVETTFYVLAISKKKVMLLRGSQSGCAEVALRGVPESVESMFFDREQRKPLQAHTIATGAVARSSPSAMFHGHGGDEEPWKERTLHWLRAVDEAVAKVLSGSTAPLILAADVKTASLFREMGPRVEPLAEWVRGSPDRASGNELWSRAWPIVQSRFQESRKDILERVAAAVGIGQGSTDLKEISRAAAEGRCAHLCVAAGAHEWGFYGAETGHFEPRPNHESGAEDLLNIAACQTLAQSAGAVSVVEPGEVPQGGSAAAMFRY